MATMIKLKLPPQSANKTAVANLPGMKGIDLDERFGVVCIDPKQHLYVVRADSVDDLESRRKLSPEILEAYGDIRISTT